MKNLILIVIIILFQSCLNQKIEKEFESKKPEVIIVYNPAVTVEKKRALDLIFAEYLDKAPPDTMMLKILNQYMLYQLDEMGYKGLVIKNSTYSPELIKQAALVYEIDLHTLVIKEFKRLQEVKDATTGVSKQIKLHGLDLIAEASVYSLKDTISERGLNKTANGSASKQESQEGQFQQTTGIKDLVKGNNNGSVKYLYDIKQLDDGIFQNLCIDAAYYLAKDIDQKIKLIYQKEQKLAKKKK